MDMFAWLRLRAVGFRFKDCPRNPAVPARARDENIAAAGANRVHIVFREQTP
jgi:hypothetical protein